MMYDGLYNDFKSLFPEDEGFFNSIEAETGVGVVFMYCFV